jgi:hypothetical protein
MANWLIDKTPLVAIKYDLLREARVGDAGLSLFGLHDDDNSYIVMATVLTGYLPEVKKQSGTGALSRGFNVLMINPITVEMCKQVAALQMGRHIYKKKSEVPYDNVSTPAEWIFNTEYTGIYNEATPVGIPQPPVDDGGDGSSEGGVYTFVQSTPSVEWVVNHNLGHYPSTEFIGVGGVGGIIDVFHVSVNQLRVYFAVPTAGTLRCE